MGHVVNPPHIPRSVSAARKVACSVRARGSAGSAPSEVDLLPALPDVALPPARAAVVRDAPELQTKRHTAEATPQMVCCCQGGARKGQLSR